MKPPEKKIKKQKQKVSEDKEILAGLVLIFSLTVLILISAATLSHLTSGEVLSIAVGGFLVCGIPSVYVIVQIRTRKKDIIVIINEHFADIKDEILTIIIILKEVPSDMFEIGSMNLSPALANLVKNNKRFYDFLSFLVTVNILYRRETKEGKSFYGIKRCFRKMNKATIEATHRIPEYRLKAKSLEQAYEQRPKIYG